MNVYTPVFNKTLAIFSILVKRDLKLSLDGERVYTEGDRVVVGKDTPLASDEVDLYGLLEKQIARLLFSSPGPLQALVAKFRNLPKEVVEKIYDTIEDYRAETCWVEIYRGSKNIFDRIARRSISEEEIKCPLTVLMAVRAGVSVDGKWEGLARFYEKQLLKIRGSTQKEAERVVEVILNRIGQCYPRAQEEIEENGEVDRFEEDSKEDSHDEGATVELPDNLATDLEQDLRMEEEVRSYRELAGGYQDSEDDCKGGVWEETEPEIDVEDLEENSTGHIIAKDIFETKDQPFQGGNIVRLRRNII